MEQKKSMEILKLSATILRFNGFQKMTLSNGTGLWLDLLAMESRFIFVVLFTRTLLFLENTMSLMRTVAILDFTRKKFVQKTSPF